MIKAILAIGLITSLSGHQVNEFSPYKNRYNMVVPEKKNEEVATLGAGCFWCVEAIFQELIGVKKVVSGYAGGHVKNPTYADVCSGSTGHAEVCQVYFDPEVISFKELLEVFWRTHDPTTLNRQGADVGTQYRSAIYYHNEDQRVVAEESKKETNESGLYNNPIVTEVEKFDRFYVAEKYHQDYFSQNPNQPYCSFTIDPKVKKFKKQFKEIIK